MASLTAAAAAASAASANRKFALPSWVDVNETGWGPTKLPEKYKDVPYVPFRKDERLNTAADFSDARHSVRARGKADWASKEANAEYHYRHDEESEASFGLVDNTKNPKRRRNYRKRYQRRYQPKERRNEGLIRRKVKMTKFGKKAKLNANRWGDRRRRNYQQETRYICRSQARPFFFLFCCCIL